jgi:ubiquinone/menaquinone biosynthesis C-methylase UbiE
MGGITTAASSGKKKGYKGLGMEGPIARWYARNTGRNDARFRTSAEDLAGQLTEGASVLEVAPGPGYLAIELAKRGRFRVVGLDISKTFVQMAAENAKAAGVDVAFHHGDAAAMPFELGSFDLIVCKAAFKNFSEPVRALNEMYRVLKPGGKAVIYDLRRDTPPEAIRAEVAKMGLGPVNTLLTKLAFKHMLLKRAYTEGQFRSMASQTPFRACDARPDAIGLEVTLTK